MWKKIKFYLALWDSIWSVPLALLLFVAFGYAGEWFFGQGFGAMSPSFLHAAFYAAFVLVFLSGIAWLGIWFNFRSVFRYYISDSKNDFKTLQPWQKLLFIVFLYSLYLLVGLTVIARLV